MQASILERIAGAGRKAALVALLGGGLIAAPVIATAQTATIYGSLGNFDVVNNTNQDAHGFEIQIEGITPDAQPYSFSYQRYGAATVVPYATGIYLRWLSSYVPATQTFTKTTVPHAPNSAFGGTCYMGSLNYDTAGCEHFGVSYYTSNPTTVTYRWLVADPQNPGMLIPYDPPVPIASPYYYIAPPPVVAPAQIPPPAVVVAEVPAPEPAEVPTQYGDAQWMKVFVTQLPREVTLEELLTNNPLVVPMDPTQVEVNWDLAQADPLIGGSNGNQKRSRKQYQGGLDPTTRTVVRRIEIYNYTGAYDPITHEAICADANVCAAPSADELGDFVSAQMTAVLVQADTLTITKTGSGNVDSSDKRLSCGSKCVSPYTAGSVVTLTAKPASGSVFTGWTGACIGSNSSCNVTVNGRVEAIANFAAAPSGGGGGGGGGGSTTSFTLSIGRSNPGTVTGLPAGDKTINCGSVCSAKFSNGTAVTLTATPPAGKTFASWGGACSGTTPTCNVTITKDTSVQANFNK